MPQVEVSNKKKNICRGSSCSYDSESDNVSFGHGNTDSEVSPERFFPVETHSPPTPLLPLPSFYEERQVVNEMSIETEAVKQQVYKADSPLKVQQNYLSSLFFMCRRQSPSTLTCLDNVLCYQHLLSEPPEWLLSLRDDVIEFAFQIRGSMNKINDSVLFCALDLFDAYIILESNSQDTIQNEAKEILLAAFVLASKLENVRHLSLKVCCELTGLPRFSRSKILEKEMCLFVHLNPILHCPSSLSFLCGLLGYSHNEEKSKEPKIEVAYHLAVYILILNISDITCRRWSAEQLGTASAWIVTLLLQSPMTPILKHVAAKVNSEEYSLICHQVMRRALQNCQKQNNKINRYFASPLRGRVTDILRKAAQTTTGAIFLSC